MAAPVTIAPSVLGPRDAGLPMTLQEFEAADYERGHRYELIHGVLVVSPIPLEQERDANEELGSWLRVYQREHPQGGALDLTLPEQNVRVGEQSQRCDRAIWAGLGRLPEPRADVPTIIVEFVSAGASDRRRDYQEKRVEYLGIGVGEYWIIDRFRRCMTALQNRQGAWIERRVEEGQTYETDVLPGFQLELARLLALADRYPKSSS